MPPIDWHQIQAIVNRSFYLVGEDLPSLVFNEDLKKDVVTVVKYCIVYIFFASVSRR